MIPINSNGLVQLQMILKMDTLTIDPETINEQSKLNIALEISARWPISVCSLLQMRKQKPNVVVTSDSLIRMFIFAAS